MAAWLPFARTPSAGPHASNDGHTDLWAAVRRQDDPCTLAQGAGSLDPRPRPSGTAVRLTKVAQPRAGFPQPRRARVSNPTVRDRGRATPDRMGGAADAT